MYLEKWYGDWVDEAGPHILYQAALLVGPLRIGFDGSLGQAGVERSSFIIGRSALPAIDGDALRWTTPIGAVTWSGPVARSFTLGRDAAVTWEPLALNGAVRGPGIGAGRRGYAERLAVRTAPWSLGIETLRWGRFCGPLSSLVWIEWVGSSAVRLALFDGREVALEGVSTSGVRIEGAVLDLEGARLFVEAPLGQGILADMPWPSRIRPLRFLSGVERKYFGRASLSTAAALAEEGEAIFEEVVWR